MASPPLVLPGVLFVGEDDRQRVMASLGPAAGWFIPHGINDWSTEVSLVTRDSLTEEIRRSAKIVMPEEQIPPAKMPLTREAALKAPIVAVSSKLVPKLVETGVRVHTVGVDRVTSSFYYLAEGGGEDPIKVSGDLVQSVGAMLGERADNAAIERVLDGLTDRLVRSLSRDRLSELSVELAALLPRAAADGTGTQDIDLEAFEKTLSELVASSEKYRTQAKLIADDIAGTYERKITLPLFGEARKISMGPFDLTVGEKKVTLPTYERWLMSGPLDESAAKAASAPPAAIAKPAPAPAPVPAPVAAVAAPVVAAVVAPVVAPPRPASVPPPRPEPKSEPKPEPKRVETKPIPREEPPEEPKKVEARPEPKPEPVAVPAPEPKKDPAPEAKPEPKPEPKLEPIAKVESEPKVAAKKAEPEAKKSEKVEKVEKTEKTEKTEKDVPQSKIDTQKLRRKEPEKSSAMIYVALILLAAAGYLAYRVWFSH